ncbi:hypothetical protein EF847_15835 [Actinobacteria bacterium YIM 96077]|uniref:Transposase (putative) YhgA-like domain-containing protein n=1 Tax=Phytoactinopolyspora halophila TaxID=1981511 RepID=A0A329QCH9_9ACTN|nr:hypothetical protein EF847_15835 [Actinobacteria bacterium YIM 96077]RAW10080.1 hypothetical protein DPM12_19655 [Phytoactinopolyspora halophila]
MSSQSGGAHDAVFRRILGEPANAASQIRAAVPAALVDRLDLDRLSRACGSFVDATLRSANIPGPPACLRSSRWSCTTTAAHGPGPQTCSTCSTSTATPPTRPSPTCPNSNSCSTTSPTSTNTHCAPGR